MARTRVKRSVLRVAVAGALLASACGKAAAADPPAVDVSDVVRGDGAREIRFRNLSRVPIRCAMTDSSGGSFEVNPIPPGATATRTIGGRTLRRWTCSSVDAAPPPARRPSLGN